MDSNIYKLRKMISPENYNIQVDSETYRILEKMKTLTKKDKRELISIAVERMRKAL